MIELILSAVGLGLMLSLVFIGPIFFLLIETSFLRGPRHALALDLGVITADILCIVAAYFASSDIVHLIDKYPSFYRITALLLFIYGLFMMLTKTKMHIKGEENLISQNYFKTFVNGFIFNLLNIGVIIFWLVTVVSVRNQYPQQNNFFLYLSLVILTYLCVDLMKIFLAKQFHDKLNQNIANRIRRIVGSILILFSFVVFLQSFKKFNRLDTQMEEAQKKEAKFQQPTL